MNINSKTYLVCPLNWGLGHASRMIPVVHELISNGNKVVLGGDGDALKLISDEFPTLQTIRIPDVTIKLRANFKILTLLKLVPQFLLSIGREKLFLSKLLRSNNFDVIISDNRYGLRNKQVHSIIVTHQLMLKLPKGFKFAEYFVHKTIKYMTSKFNECWVPDFREKELSLSGDLSHKYPLCENVKFIGTLSRFSTLNDYSEQLPHYNIAVILSGPEPLRQKLENKLFRILKNTEYKVLIVRGKPKNKTLPKVEGNITIHQHIASAKLKQVILYSDVIICRSGYSSIMDLHYLSRNAILIPTIGQTEQEYLAEHLKNRFRTLQHSKIDSELMNLLNSTLKHIH